MNAKAIVPLVIALALGGLAAKVGKDMLAKGRQGRGAAELTKVVVVREDVAPGAVLRESDLALRDTPADGLSEHAFTRVSDVLGRVVTAQLVKHQTVLETLLAPRGTLGGAQAMVPPGMRAVAVEVNEFSGVAGLITPGCHVDVVQSIQMKGENAGMMAKTIVERLKVLAVGRRMGNAAGGAAATVDGDTAKSVTLLATAEQAEVIDLATRVGQPRLVLRNTADEAVTGGRGVTVGDLRGDTKQKSDGLAEIVSRLLHSNRPATRPATPAVTVAARPEPRPFREVEVIRGGTSTSVRMGLPAGAGSFVGDSEKLDGAVPSGR
jgi:pilus assembly protein CpaB